MKIYWNGKTKNIIGPRIKKLRKQRDLTQKHMAELLQLQGHEFSDLTILRIEQAHPKSIATILGNVNKIKDAKVSPLKSEPSASVSFTLPISSQFQPVLLL